MLKTVGKREQHHRFGPLERAALLFDDPIGAATMAQNANNAISLPSFSLYDPYVLHKHMHSDRPYGPKIDALISRPQKQMPDQGNNENDSQRQQPPHELQRTIEYTDDSVDDGSNDNHDEFIQHLNNY